MLEWKAFSAAVSQADWAELTCFHAGRKILSGAEIKQYLNREIGDDESEIIVTDIKGQIDWRRAQIPVGYPFTISEGNIVQENSWRDFLPYAFMLLLATHSYYDETKITRWNETAKLFERLVNFSIKLHLGHAINIGSPRIPSEAPKSFQKCIIHVSKAINESKGVTPRIVWRKDGGVDVIGWRKLDERPGKIVFLVQCAAGESWENKDRIHMDSWRQWICFATKPIEVLAFPSICFVRNKDEQEAWRFNCDGRLLMDRLRLATFKSKSLPTDLRTDLRAWCSAQLARLPRPAE